MDTSVFSSAQHSYDTGDYVAALAGFQALARDTSQAAPGETGRLCHLMGNCLVKLRRYQEAAQAYQSALADRAYDRIGAVNSNLGMALTACHRYDEALPCFEAALSDPTYETPYKAFSGMGSALLKLGRTAEAGIAYRRAALDEGNPDPAKALVNLGVCFMALGRPHDAVEAYSAALEFDTTPASRCKTCANLGQAYVATGRMADAVTAFEQATADGTYRLSQSAADDYARAQAAGIVAQQQAPQTGLAAQQGATGAYDQPLYQQGYDQQPYEQQAYPEQEYSQTGSIIPSADDTGFFTVTEDQLVGAERQEVKQGRKMRHTGLKVAIVILVILVILVAAGAFAFIRGYGYPTQETVVNGMFSSVGTSAESGYWDSSIESTTIERAMASVESGTTITVDSVDRSMNSSVVYVTATLPEGGQVDYTVDLARSGISWKATGLSLTFASRG